MKRVLYLFLCLTICLCAISCASRQDDSEQTINVVALEIGCTADSEDGGEHRSEYALWATEEHFTSADVANDCEVSFMNAHYAGTYWYSCTELYDTYQSDYYKYDKGFFALRHDTHTLVAYVHVDESNESDYGTYTLEQCRRIADDLAQQYIDLSDFQVEATDHETMCGFVYVRYFDDLKTREILTVGVSTGTGQVLVYSSGMLGEFDEADLRSQKQKIELLEAAAPEKIGEKLNSIYSNYSSYEIENMKIVKLEDGQYGIGCSVSVGTESKLSDGTIVPFESLVTIIICEGK